MIAPALESMNVIHATEMKQPIGSRLAAAVHVCRTCTSLDSPFETSAETPSSAPEEATRRHTHTDRHASAAPLLSHAHAVSVLAMSASAPPNPLAIQMSVKANAQDLNAYLRDLQSWTSDVKAKDQKLKTGEMTLTKTPLAARPIRGAPAAPVVLPSSATADQQRFAAEKAAGNAAFTRGEFDTAITHYSQCMILMPHDAISASNRSQALLKLRRFHESESDATTAIELDPTHVKSYFRRAQARKELRKYAGAVEDTEKIAQLDKTNKPAQALHKECTEMLKKQQQARAQVGKHMQHARASGGGADTLLQMWRVIYASDLSFFSLIRPALFPPPAEPAHCEREASCTARSPRHPRAAAECLRCIDLCRCCCCRIVVVGCLFVGCGAGNWPPHDHPGGG